MESNKISVMSRKANKKLEEGMISWNRVLFVLFSAFNKNLITLYNDFISTSTGNVWI